jgi:hypothetical protein
MATASGSLWFKVDGGEWERIGDKRFHNAATLMEAAENQEELLRELRAA